MTGAVVTIAVTSVPASPPASDTPAPSTGHTTLLLIVFAICMWIGWRISLRIHPWTACKACGGEPRSYGSVFRRSFALCGACGGTGRQLRFGVKPPTS